MIICLWGSTEVQYQEYPSYRGSGVQEYMFSGNSIIIMSSPRKSSIMNQVL